MKKDQDKLEEFVDKHLDDFNQFEPSDKVWNNIKGNIPKKSTTKVVRMIPLHIVIKIAAAFILLIGIGSVLLFMNDQQPSNTVELIANEEEPVPFSMSSLSPELAEIEDYYYTQVSNKLLEIDQLNLDPEALEEIDFLSKEFADLQQEFTTSADDEKVIEAMIENYRLRLDILEDILETINQTEKVIDDEKDTDDIVIYV